MESVPIGDRRGLLNLRCQMMACGSCPPFSFKQEANMESSSDMAFPIQP